MAYAHATSTSTRAPRNIAWRTIAFSILATLFGLGSLFFLEGLTEALLPWVVLGCPGCPPDAVYNIDQQLWHGAEHGALLGIMFGGSLFALVKHAALKPLLLQFYALGHVVLVFGYVPFSPPSKASQMVMLIVMMALTTGLLIATYPRTRALFDFSVVQRGSRELLALTAAAALALAPVTLQNFQYQLTGFGGEHAEQMRWMGAVILAVCLVSAGLLAASRRPGWQTLANLLGATYVYLGVAALTVPNQPGSWGILGGALALIGGAAYLIVTRREARRPV